MEEHVEYPDWNLYQQVLENLTIPKIREIIQGPIVDNHDLDRVICSECGIFHYPIQICLDCCKDAGIFDKSMKRIIYNQITQYEHNIANFQRITVLDTFHKAKQLAVCNSCIQFPKDKKRHIGHEWNCLISLYRTKDVREPLFDRLSRIAVLKMEQKQMKEKEGSFTASLYFCQRSVWSLDVLRECRRYIHNLPHKLMKPFSDLRKEVVEVRAKWNSVAARSRRVGRRWRIAGVEWQKMMVEKFRDTDEAKNDSEKFEEILKEMDEVWEDIRKEDKVGEEEEEGMTKEIRRIIFEFKQLGEVVNDPAFDGYMEKLEINAHPYLIFDKKQDGMEDINKDVKERISKCCQNPADFVVYVEEGFESLKTAKTSLFEQLATTRDVLILHKTLSKQDKAKDSNMGRNYLDLQMRIIEFMKAETEWMMRHVVYVEALKIEMLQDQIDSLNLFPEIFISRDIS